MYLAMLLGVVAAGLGIAVAAEYDTAPGATIVLLAIAIFAAIAAGATLRRRLRRPRLAVARQVEPPDVVLEA
jgi:zinc transport system permease protein